MSDKDEETVNESMASGCFIMMLGCGAGMFFAGLAAFVCALAWALQ